MGLLELFYGMRPILGNVAPIVLAWDAAEAARHRQPHQVDTEECLKIIWKFGSTPNTPHALPRHASVNCHLHGIISPWKMRTPNCTSPFTQCRGPRKLWTVIVAAGPGKVISNAISFSFLVSTIALTSTALRPFHSLFLGQCQPKSTMYKSAQNPASG